MATDFAPSLSRSMLVYLVMMKSIVFKTIFSTLFSSKHPSKFWSNLTFAWDKQDSEVKS